MKSLKYLFVTFFVIWSGSVLASDSLPIGKIQEISYRGGWITLKVIGDDGTNYCEPCPADPGARSTKKCWIEETKQAQISMLLSAQARGKRIYGRVSDFATNCNIYQMSIED